MSDVPYATEKDASYENFLAKCPSCGYTNIFNRVTDLKDTSPIAFKIVHCFNVSCKKPFKIGGDSVNSAYEMLIFDCYVLMKEKRYCYCILNLAQAFEVFFSQYLRVELLYKPFAKDAANDMDNIEHLNSLSQLLYEKIKRYAYNDMRNIFIRRALLSQPIPSLKLAETVIENIDTFVKAPKNSDIDKTADAKFLMLLRALKDTKVGELRNKVVHKAAYRPNLKEVEACLKETRGILLPLAVQLEVQFDDVNWYISRRA
jgi:hypothetical protein